jgi:dihydrofolate synthase/folylpolyglutamate synthase
MNYTQTLDFLYGKLPMFTRIGEAALKKDLHNTIALCERLGNPQDRFKTIHVAGTNGKGSTSHMLAAILQKAGYKTGLYTSPHLKDFRERIRIDGKMVSKSFVSSFVEGQRDTIEEIQPSFFEVTVAMAFSYFALEKVDVAIIEVGLGGRLDSTNIIHPDLSIITNISLDHTNILGSTLEEIAFEKAGIIKTGVPAVVGEKEMPSQRVFIEKAGAVNTSLEFASDHYHAEDVQQHAGKLQMNILKDGQPLYKNLELDLTGTYQLKNVVTVVAAVQQLVAGGYKLGDTAVYAGLKNVKKITGLQGRWQKLGDQPTIICDTGHNVAGIREVLRNIEATPHKQLHMVIGMVKDKDIGAVLKLLPSGARYYFSQPALERALPAAALQAKAHSFGLAGESYDTVKEAFAAARLSATPDDLIFVGGSTFIVAEVL